jgi:hypothetical protein
MFHLSPDEKPQSLKPCRPVTAYRNPIILAREWQQALNSGKYSTQADFARRQGISRARVTQVLHLLNLAPDVLNAIAALGDPLPSRIITERTLRSMVHRSPDVQRHAVGRKVIKSSRMQEHRSNHSD